MSKHGKNYLWSTASKGPPCHTGPVQIMKNLYCGSEREFLAKADEKVFYDVMVPLSVLDGDIWESGFRGEILYYPIMDYGTLPTDVLEEVVGKILNRLTREKKVGVFCMGGHGRTGYLVSIVLGKCGCEDPIQYLRKHYCTQAVESNGQVRHIADVLDKPELVGKHRIAEKSSRFREDYCIEGLTYFDSLYSSAYAPETEYAPTCDDCVFFGGTKCELHGCIVGASTAACVDFTED